MIKKIFLLLSVAIFANVAQAKALQAVSSAFNKAIERENISASLKHSQETSQISAQTEAEPLMQDENPEDKKMVTCPECGKRLPAGSKCSNHHKPILLMPVEEEQSVQESAFWNCTECGRKVSMSRNFCSRNHKAVYYTPQNEENASSDRTKNNSTVSTTKANQANVSSCPADNTRCPDCGRTPQQVALSGHNHK